jgi:hypothetical protein
VARAALPERTAGLKDAPGRKEPSDVLFEALPKPFERIESLRPVLRFRVLLRNDGANKLEVVR